MRFFAMIAALVLSLMTATIEDSQHSDKKQTDYSSREQALKLWEAAIKAQGGRERLWSIDNMAIMSTTDSRWKGRRYQTIVSDFYVFPNKLWWWVDERPSIFGLLMTMKNWETGKTYHFDSEEKEFDGLKALPEKDVPMGFAGLIGILLETRWNQPKVESTFPGKVGRKQVDIIRTALNGNQLDFALDRATYLPVQVTASSSAGRVSRTSMSDFKEFDGIMMPTVVIFHSSDGNTKYKRSYRFNVEYEESIFEKPPSFEAGPEAWRKMK